MEAGKGKIVLLGELCFSEMETPCENPLQVWQSAKSRLFFICADIQLSKKGANATETAPNGQQNSNVRFACFKDGNKLKHFDDFVNHNVEGDEVDQKREGFWWEDSRGRTFGGIVSVLSERTDIVGLFLVVHHNKKFTQIGRHRKNPLRSLLYPLMPIGNQIPNIWVIPNKEYRENKRFVLERKRRFEFNERGNKLILVEGFSLRY